MSLNLFSGTIIKNLFYNNLLWNTFLYIFIWMNSFEKWQLD